MINKKIKRAIRYTKDTLTYLRVFSQPEKNIIYEAYQIDSVDAHSLRVAKQLHASVYLAVGFIDKVDINDDIIHHVADPHQKHAVYFAVRRRNIIVSMARQIMYKGQGSHHESFPVLSQAYIHIRSKRRIEAIHPKEIIEISALVKKTGESSIVPLLMYRELWRYSIRNNHKVWIMACDIRLYERLKLLFGPALTIIGRRTSYKGGDVVPLALDIEQSVRYLQRTVKERDGGIFKLRWHAARFMLNKLDY